MTSFFPAIHLKTASRFLQNTAHICVCIIQKYVKIKPQKTHLSNANGKREPGVSGGQHVEVGSCPDHPIPNIIKLNISFLAPSRAQEVTMSVMFRAVNLHLSDYDALSQNLLHSQRSLSP